MACFSCTEGKTSTQVQILQMYKDAYERTGIVYWFYKKIGTNEIMIASGDDFNKFKKANAADFKKNKYEFSHIAEFTDTINS